MPTEDELRKRLVDLDRELEATRGTLRRAQIKYNNLRYERRKVASTLRQLPYRTYKQRSGMDDTHVADTRPMVEFIQLWLVANDGSLKQIADRSQVSVKTISDILHGRRIWSTVSTVDMILTAIGAHWLLDDLEIKENKRGRPPKRPESQYYEE